MSNAKPALSSCSMHMFRLHLPLQSCRNDSKKYMVSSSLARLWLPFSAHCTQYSFRSCNRNNGELSYTNSGFKISLLAQTAFHRIPSPLEDAVSSADNLKQVHTQKPYLTKNICIPKNFCRCQNEIGGVKWTFRRHSIEDIDTIIRLESGKWQTKRSKVSRIGQKTS